MPVPAELAFASIRTLGQRLRNGDVTAVELAEFFLDRLEKYGPRLNSVVTVTRELALSQAKAADSDLAAGRDHGPLHGIPFGVKDLLATKGIPTSWGAAPFKDQLFEEDATTVIGLRRAGAVLCAKLAMVEIAGGFGYEQANASFTGPGLNPWNVTRWSGGSSSGPGSAVGAGLVPFAIGSETWGSIVTPSAFCSVTGLRPTYGRVSRHGAMALSWTMDKLGPMGRTADDCGLVLDAIAGPDPADPSAAERSYRYPPKKPRERPFKLLVIKGAADHVQEGIRASYERSLEVLKEREIATFETIELPELPVNEAAATIVSCELAAAFEGFVRSGDVWELTAPEDRWGGHGSLTIPAVDYINALRLRRIAQRALDGLLADADAIVTPTRATVAPPIDRPFREYDRGFRSTSIGGAGNLCGLPAVCVPNGFGESDLPTSLQFVGRAFEENRLIAVAAAYQAATDWHERQPNLDAAASKEERPEEKPSDPKPSEPNPSPNDEAPPKSE